MFSKLNDQQIQAVEIDMHALVIACPGSGKTRVLTAKIAFELEKPTSKRKKIAALTYTNRAAEEIQKRLDEMGTSKNQLWAGTIHSFCYQWIIKPYAGYLSELKNGFTIIDEFKKRKLLDEIKEEFGLPSWAEINTSLNRKGEYLNIDAYNNEVAKKFHHTIIRDKQIDFDLLLYHSWCLLRLYPRIAKNLAGLFSYVFVDEYQDTQDLQYAIIGEIIKASKKQCKLFLVGDPDQSIYGSLGGTARSLFEIQGEIGDEEIIQLELSGNYRSTQRIIDFFSHFKSTDISIESESEFAHYQGEITFDIETHKDELYMEFAEIIRNNLENGMKPQEICIIAPRWQFLTPLARELKALLPDVPFEAPGVTPLPRNIDNFWYKLARLFLTETTPALVMSRLRWMAEIIDELNHFTHHSMETNGQNCRKLLKILNSSRSNEEQGIFFLKQSFHSFLNKLSIDLEIYPVLMDQQDSFFNSINERYASDEFAGIPSDVAYFQGMFKPSKGIVINTCHGVKGEEFETVIAFGLLRGYIPHWNSIINQEDFVEEDASKKLLYVIGSRSKRNLHLFAETGRLTQRKKRYEINRQLNNVAFAYDNEMEYQS
ncbi:TPA: ATP-dependent helicase [Bacillus cereus]|nr:ATP-dependent helicase [Bacillus cereus]